MAKEIPPWTKSGLPGRPVIEDADGNGIAAVNPSRIIRARNGKILYFGDAFECQTIAKAASEFLERDIRRVRFMSKKGGETQQFALAGPGEAQLSKADIAAIEAFIWAQRRETGKPKRKKVRLASVWCFFGG